ncbi:MAG: zinc-binding dehydrogenase [Rickettsiaceae bacterium]|nr:zinc-binding dehydrogenase [Rickettsiaceae bacterium]
MYAFGITRDKITDILKIPLNKRIPSECIQLMECKKPIPKADEVVVEVKGAGLNYNSVWQSLCHPMNSKQLVDGHIKRNPLDANHSQDYYIFGSDGSGVVSEIGCNVSSFKKDDEVVIHCNVVQQSSKLKDDMLSNTQSIWGYETNYGSFAEYTCVKESQLLLKPHFLNWPNSGSYMLTLATAYRMLISKNGSKIKKGEFCLIWGASGGLGYFAIQLCILVGAIPVCIVSSKDKETYCKKLGATFVINLDEYEDSFMLENDKPNYIFWHKLKIKINYLIKAQIDVVFEHIGKDTLGFSVYLLKRGGRVVTCAASSGYLSTIDLRYLWMELKTIIGSHFANINEAKLANDLVLNNLIKVESETVIQFEEIPRYLDKLYYRDNIKGKIAVKI